MATNSRARLIDDVCTHRAALQRVAKRLVESQTENARLQEFTLALAERIHRAHEVLGRLAERKDKR